MGHDRGVGIAAGDNQLEGGVQFPQLGGGFHTTHSASHRQVQYDRVKTPICSFGCFIEGDGLCSVGGLHIVTETGKNGQLRSALTKV